KTAQEGLFRFNALWWQFADCWVITHVFYTTRSKPFYQADAVHFLSTVLHFSPLLQRVLGD
ncbi:MAG: hypothetical protein US81_C0003G0001, partial [Parcubacteria group bacterium GW2011_GWE2_38_18]